VLVPKVGRAKAKTYSLRPTTKAVAAAATAKIKLKVPAATATAIRRALKAGKRIIVKLKIRVVDEAGNTRMLTREVRLRR